MSPEPAPTGYLAHPDKDHGGCCPKPRFTVEGSRPSGVPQGNKRATHPQGFLGGQARPPTPIDDSQGGRRRCHLHSTFPPGNGCARCPLGKEERGIVGKPGGGGGGMLCRELQLRVGQGPWQAGMIREPPHHRPPCSCPGHWPCGRLAPVDPEAHLGPSGLSTHADPHGRAQWSSPAQRIYKGEAEEGLRAGGAPLPPLHY